MNSFFLVLTYQQLFRATVSFTPAVAGQRKLKNPNIVRKNTSLGAQQHPPPLSLQQNKDDFQQRSKSWVVLVDDEESIRLSIGKYLYDAGYTVTACADGEALLELLTSASTRSSTGASSASSTTISTDDPTGENSDNTSPLDLESMPTKFPSVIICDIRMPGGMDGLQILDILKNNPSATSQLIPNNENNKNSSNVNDNRSTGISPDASLTSDLDFIRMQWKMIPVVFLTAKSLTQDRIEGYRRGADVYLPKPFSPEELLSIVDNLVRRMRELSTGISNTASVSGDETIRTTQMTDLKNDLIEIKALLRDARGLAERRRKESIRGNYNSGMERGGRTNNGRTNNRMLNPASSSLPTLSSSSPSLPPSSALVTRENAKRWSAEVDEIRNNVTLTPTEIEVLKLLSDGHTNSEISKLANDGAGFTVVRVGKTISSLYAKTLTKTRTELVRWGIKMGYVSAK